MMDYKRAGVGIEVGCKSVELMKEYARRTMRSEVLGGLGGPLRAFPMSAFKGMEEPTPLSDTNSMGARLRLAFLMDKHDTMGTDCVATRTNNVACTGGKPLFFLDHVACGKNVPKKIAMIVKGVAGRCRQSGSALIGRETVEIPGFYPEGEYDLAGSSVDIIDKKGLITGENLCTRDVLIGMVFSDVHNNGFSLVRKIFEKELTKEDLDTYYDELGTILGKALLVPAKTYVKALRNIKEVGATVKAYNRITDGGFYENIPHMLKDDVKIVIRKDSYPVPPVFRLLTDKGQIKERMMHNTYNMRLGVIITVDPTDVEKAMEAMRVTGEAPYAVDSIEEGEKGVSLC